MAKSASADNQQNLLISSSVRKRRKGLAFREAACVEQVRLCERGMG